MSGEGAEIIPYKPINDARAVVEKHFSNLPPESFVQVDVNRFNSQEIGEAFSVIQAEYKSKVANFVEGDFPIHVAYFLLRAAYVGTSVKTTYRGSYSYKIDGKTYNINDSWVFPMVKIAAGKFNKNNPLRAFTGSLEDYYLMISAAMPNVFKGRSIGSKGAPVGLERFSADFLTASSSVMNNHERAVTMACAKNAIERSLVSSDDRTIVSLYDLGKC